MSLLQQTEPARQACLETTHSSFSISTLPRKGVVTRRNSGARVASGCFVAQELLLSLINLFINTPHTLTWIANVGRGINVIAWWVTGKAVGEPHLGTRVGWVGLRVNGFIINHVTAPGGYWIRVIPHPTPSSDTDPMTRLNLSFRVIISDELPAARLVQ